MKTLFSIMLIFLFLSCGGGKKTTESVVPDEDFDQDIDIVDDDDDEFVEDEESDDENMPDADIENETDPAHDADEETEIIPDPCETEPCKGVENSTEKCFSYGKNGYACECKSSYVWFSSEQKCLPVTNFVGTVCTGQTKCYDMEKEIQCPKEGETFYGQDAQYAKMGKCFPRNYTIKQYDDGETVVDNNTRLEWQRGFAPISNFLVACNPANLSLGGKVWRLPTPKELFTIVNSEYFDPAIDKAYFPETPAEFFYSSEYRMQAGFTYQVMYFGGVNFKYGTVEHYSSSDHGGGILPESGQARCVRSETEQTECNVHVLTIDEYGIKLDPSTNLVVKNVAESDKNWKDALDYCENLTYAGISDWRLPNKDELQFLSLTGNTGSFWTSTTSTHDFSKAVVLGSDSYYDNNPYEVDEIPLKVSFSSKESLQNVLCVTSNPCGEGELWAGEKCVPFADLGIDDTGCNCKDGYSWHWGVYQCVKQ
jgi:hypothetical protein